jgi:hypothetical protein
MQRREIDFICFNIHLLQRLDIQTNFRALDHLEDQGVDGRMGSKWTLGRLVGGVEWIRLAQDRDRWRTLVNAVMNLQVLAPQS